MTLSHAEARLSREELVACWIALDLGEPPALLQLTGLAAPTVAEGEHRLRLVLAGLAERGLGDGSHPAPGLAERLELFARPEYRLDIRFPGADGRPVLGIGAVRGAHGVVIVGPEGPTETLELVAMDSTRVIDTLLGLVGDIPPGRSAPINIPADVLDRAVAATRDNNVWSLADALRDRGIPRSDASALARMCTDIRFGAILGATAVHDGAERRGGWVISFHYAESGYFLKIRRGGFVTMCPADGPRLAQRWRELADSLRVFS